MCSSVPASELITKGGENKNLKYVAVDIGKRNCKACKMNADGSIAEESKYDNKLTEAEIFAYSMVKKYGKCVAVCESISNL